MSSVPLSVLTWNINLITGTAATLEPLAALSPRPDVVTLQEVNCDRASEICERLLNLGYQDVVYSGRPAAEEKSYGNVIAARTQLARCGAQAFGFPWPQLVAHAKVAVQGEPVNVITVHVPNGEGNGWKKIYTLDALRHMVLALEGAPLILTGDFNEPRWEPLQNGEVVTWGQEWDGERWEVESGEWRDKHGVKDKWSKWDAAVRWFFDADSSGLSNAFWESRGEGSMEQTHISGGSPRWFDHIFVSDCFAVDDCAYLHEVRQQEISDHSALLATLSASAG